MTEGGGPKRTGVPKLLSQRSNAPTTKMDPLSAMHPGEVLREEYPPTARMSPISKAGRAARQHKLRCGHVKRAAQPGCPNDVTSPTGGDVSET